MARMVTGLLTLAVVAIAAGPLVGCNGDTDNGNGNGGGGGGQHVDNKDLPDSNNVNPTVKPDSYIDDSAKAKGEAKHRQAAP